VTRASNIAAVLLNNLLAPSEITDIDDYLRFLSITNVSELYTTSENPGGGISG